MKDTDFIHFSMDKQLISKTSIPQDIKKKDEQIVTQEHVLKDIDSESAEDKRAMKKFVIGIYIVLVILGVGTGYMLSGRQKGGVVPKTSQQTMIQTDKVVGST